MKQIKLCYSKNCDINYAARLVTIEEQDFMPHPNATKLKLARVFGFKVIVGIDATPGDYIFFPAGSRISDSFLFYSSNYHDSRRNKDKSASGTFEQSGRVKAIKLRGTISEGWLCKSGDLEEWIKELAGTEDIEIDYGTGSFDTALLEKGRTAWICKKYIVKGDSGVKKQRFRGSVPGRLVERVPKDQFRFHYETEQLKWNPWVIKPKTYIWITKKVDGTSGISSNTQVERKWWEFWKPKRYYHRLYASSGVIKSKEVNREAGPGWYGVDIWKYADNVIGPLLESGMTAYYEILGYLPDGRFIQKADDFGCAKPEPGKSYRVGQNFRVLIYRITITTPEGTVMEMNPKEVKEWAESKGLESVKILYEGLAQDLYPDLSPELHFSENFLDRLAEDHGLGMEEHESECKNQDVPQEGIVIRVGKKAYKLKTTAHLLWKQKWEENGALDIEDFENQHGQ